MMKKLILAALASLVSICAFAVVDINTANQQQLEAINGLGPAKAKAIIDYRSKSGPFKSVDDIKKVPGIKDGVFKQIKADISVGSGAAPKTAAPAVKK